MMANRTKFLLLLAALLLAGVFFPLGLLYTAYKAIRRRSLAKAVGYLANTAFAISLAIDTMGGVICRDLLNDTLIMAESKFRFGNYWETISRVLGLNKAKSTLTKSGYRLATLLNCIDADHVEKAANTDYAIPMRYDEN